MRSRSQLWAAAAFIGLMALEGCAPVTSVRKEQAVGIDDPSKVTKMVGPKRRIGVVDFETKAKYAQGRLGTAASDILITELAKSGRFIIVERDRLAKIMEEQKLGMSGAIDPRSAVQVGKILGLNAIVTGAVSQFGVKTEGSDYLITQSKRQVAEATVDIRVVDAETGQVLLADSGKGYAKSAKGSILGLGTRGGYDETLEGEALRAGIAKFVDNIVMELSRKPWSCRIAQVSGEMIYLNAGPSMGLETGTELDCFHLGREITDPTTGLSLGHEEVPLGRVRVEGPLGAGGEGSRARLTRSAGAMPAPKDICRLPQ